MEANVWVPKLDPKKCTLTVKVDVRELRVRMAIGLWLMKLGARVIGLGVRIEPLEVMEDVPICPGCGHAPHRIAGCRQENCECIVGKNPAR